MSAVLNISKKTKIEIEETRELTIELLEEIDTSLKCDVLDAIFQNNIPFKFRFGVDLLHNY